LLFKFVLKFKIDFSNKCIENAYSYTGLSAISVYTLKKIGAMEIWFATLTIKAGFDGGGEKNLKQDLSQERITQ
jgi:hypothetical protein